MTWVVASVRSSRLDRFTVNSKAQKIEPPQVFSGWKDIANYLGMGVRTVQRYERLHGASSTGRAANPDMLRKTLQSVLRDKLKITLGPREDGLHLLRHTSGSLVLHKTGNGKEVQKWLGHGSIKTTLDIYPHLMQESQKATANQVFARPQLPTATGQEN